MAIPYPTFISHIHEEHELAGKPKETRESCFLHAVRAFVSSHEENIRVGDDGFADIESHLRAADTVVLLLTRRKLKRLYPL